MIGNSFLGWFWDIWFLFYESKSIRILYKNLISLNKSVKAFCQIIFKVLNKSCLKCFKGGF